MAMNTETNDKQDSNSKGKSSMAPKSNQKMPQEVIINQCNLKGTKKYSSFLIVQTPLSNKRDSMSM